MKAFKLEIGAPVPGWFWMNLKGGHIRLVNCGIPGDVNH